MATWPTTLPLPQSDGYALDPVDPTARTDMEVGAARTRRRTKARNDKVSVTWLFTDAQMATFRTWFDSDTDAAGGSAWFTVSIPIGTTGLASKDCKFVGVYKAKMTGILNWFVSATLEVR